MKNLVHLTVILFITLFTLNSCQQNDLYEINHLQPLPSQGERLSKNNIQINTSALTYASIQTIHNITTERALRIETISCNSETIYGTTHNATSTFHSGNTPCVDENGDSFRGDDNIFYFVVDNLNSTTVTHHFELTDLNDDLDLFLYTLSPQGRINECKASSITIGLADEMLEVTNLNTGAYILVVDGWNEQVASTYTLDVYCTSRSAQTPSVNINDFVDDISFGMENNVGNIDTIGKIYLDGEQWKEHIWSASGVDNFANDMLLEEFESGNNYLVLQAADDRYIEIQFAEETIYVYASNFSDLKIYDILSINE